MARATVMLPPMHIRSLASLALVGAATALALPAQQYKVVPSGMDFVEGPAVSTPPFSATTSGIQILIDASQVTSGTAVLTGISLRPSQTTSSSPGFTKPYQLNCYTVPTTAAAFEAMASPYDPNNVIAGALPTLVFNGPLTLPAAAPLAVAPAPFSINIPFNPPYVYDSTQGNLLLMLETTDLTVTPGTYRIDAVTFSESSSAGIVAPIDLAGCAPAGNSITSTTSPASSVNVGGVINTQLTRSTPGAFPAAIVMLSFTRADLDLFALLGMPTCTGRLGTIDLTQFVLETPGGYPLVQWSVPPDPIFHGVALITQSLGLSVSGLIADSVDSNAEALRLGPQAAPPGVTARSGFHTVTMTVNNWVHGTTGQNVPVVQLEGILP